MPQERGRSQWLRIRRELTGYFLVAPALIFLLLLTVYPLARTVQMSFTDLKAGEWLFVGLEHYRAALDDKWLWNSVRAVVAFYRSGVGTAPADWPGVCPSAE